jgi:hypothetical protein
MVVLAVSEPVDVIPAVVRLPPVILPVALIVVPAVIADVALTLPPLMLPVVDIIPDPADKLPPLTLPVAMTAALDTKLPEVVRLPRKFESSASTTRLVGNSEYSSRYA